MGDGLNLTFSRKRKCLFSFKKKFAIYKGKGETADLKNHRGVCIGNATLKLYETMIDARSSPVIEQEGFTEYQAGGRRKRGIADHLFIIRAVLDHAIYLNILVIFELLDLVKAFDKMQLKLVMNDMWHAGIKGRIWRNMYNINKEAKIYIKTPLGITEGHEIGETVKQGSVLASKMASMHTDGVNRMFENTGMGINYGNIIINNLVFQDDVIKLENSEHKLNQANQIYRWFAQVNGMKFHEIKSQWMSNSKTNLEVKLDHKPLKRVKKAKYLGDMLTPDGKIDETIAQRKSAITGMMVELSLIMDDIGESRIEVALQYYTGIITPKLLTNSETWSMISNQNTQELEKIQNTTLKRLLRLPNGTPSCALRAELGVWSVRRQIMKRKLMYLHKLINYPEENLTRRILMEQTTMPSPTWISKLQLESLTTGISIDLEELKSIGKEKWVKTINEAMQKAEDQDLVEFRKTSKKYGDMQGTVKAKEYIKMSTEESMNILKLRLGMTAAKANYHNMYNETSCRRCKKENETAEHLIKCNMDNTEENHELMSNYQELIQKIETSEISKLKMLSVLVSQSIVRASTLDASHPPLDSYEEQHMEGGDLVEEGH